jgi:Predicted membrane protein (DUF2306)
MSTIAAPPIHPKKKTPHLLLKALASGAMIAIAIAFVLKYVFHYYLNYNQTGFAAGAANYWALRGWLLMHITGGTVALLVGPSQFWTGFRVRFARLHRLTGFVFLGAVVVGSIGAYHMAYSTTFGWGFGFALAAMATAWVTTTGVAYYAILKRRIQIHKEWMVRAYVVTFSFVTFRIFNDYGPTSRLLPADILGVTVAWGSFTIPLFITIVVQQLWRMRSSSGAT